MHIVQAVQKKINVKYVCPEADFVASETTNWVKLAKSTIAQLTVSVFSSLPHCYVQAPGTTLVKFSSVFTANIWVHPTLLTILITCMIIIDYFK